MMPQKIICGGCGEVLYDRRDLKSPRDLILQLNGICPKCGKELIFDPMKVSIGVSKKERLGG